MSTPRKAAIRLLVILLLSIGALLTLAAAFQRVRAAPLPAPQVLTSDQQCLECHSRPYLVTHLPNGDVLNATVDGGQFAGSIHGQNALNCASCHSAITAYPHPALAAENAREVAIDFSQSCQDCHAGEFAQQHDSIHQQAQLRGNQNAAVCSDCHNPHNTAAPAASRATVIETCTTCHSDIAGQYQQSVHGTALLNEGNQDVPGCTDCHGVHDIASPVTAQFLQSSPKLCANCHADQQKMAKYGLNANVLNTYLGDFHGTTVSLFGQHSPDQLSNKPLCIDCHGVHDITSVQAANSSVIEDNLLATCQQCHPGAQSNFPSAWLSHYSPSPSRNALVYGVGVFYRVLIPVVIGGMLLFVLADIGHRLLGRRKAKQVNA